MLHGLEHMRAARAINKAGRAAGFTPHDHFKQSQSFMARNYAAGNMSGLRNVVRR